MANLKIRATAKAPRVSIPMEKAKLEKIDGDSTHPLISFQPTMRVKVPKDSYSPEEVKRLEEWWEDLRASLGDTAWELRLSPFIEENDGFYRIWTFSGDIDVEDPVNNVWGDDSE